MARSRWNSECARRESPLPAANEGLSDSRVVRRHRNHGRWKDSNICCLGLASVQWRAFPASGLQDGARAGVAEEVLRLMLCPVRFASSGSGCRCPHLRIKFAAWVARMGAGCLVSFFGGNLNSRAWNLFEWQYPGPHSAVEVAGGWADRISAHYRLASMREGDSGLGRSPQSHRAGPHSAPEVAGGWADWSSAHYRLVSTRVVDSGLDRLPQSHRLRHVPGTRKQLLCCCWRWWLDGPCLTTSRSFPDSQTSWTCSGAQTWPRECEVVRVKMWV